LRLAITYWIAACPGATKRASFPIAADAVRLYVDQGFLMVHDLVSPAEQATL